MSPSPLSVVVADDSSLLRSGVVRALELSGAEVVGEAGDAADLLHLVEAIGPDLAVVDIRMPPTHTDEGLRAAAVIRDRHPKVGLLVLSQYLEPEYASDFLAGDARAKGYLLKHRVTDLGILAEAAHRVGHGGTALDPEVVNTLFDRAAPSSPFADLTPREREVLALMSEGLSNAAVVDRLVLSTRTVEGHVAEVYRKLGLPPERTVHRRVQAVLAWIRATT